MSQLLTALYLCNMFNSRLTFLCDSNSIPFMFCVKSVCLQNWMINSGFFLNMFFIHHGRLLPVMGHNGCPMNRLLCNFVENHDDWILFPCPLRTVAVLLIRTGLSEWVRTTSTCFFVPNFAFGSWSWDSCIVFRRQVDVWTCSSVLRIEKPEIFDDILASSARLPYPLWFGRPLWITVYPAGLFQVSFCVSGSYPVNPFAFHVWIWPVFANQPK